MSQKKKRLEKKLAKQAEIVTKQKTLPISNTWIIALLFLSIIIIYFFISSKLFSKDPGIFPDETVLADLSYSLINPNSFGKLPFDNKFTVIEKVSLTHNPYPLLYHLILMLPLTISYSIFTIRFVPLVFGLFSLFFTFLIIKKISKNPYLAIFGTFLLAIDMNFLRCVRFGRTDSAALFFNLWLVYLYIKYLSENDKFIFKKIIPLIIISIFGIFTHFLIGSIATMTIVAHFIMTRLKFKKTIILAGIFTLILAITLITLSSMGIDIKSTTIGARLIPGFHSTKMILNDKFTLDKINFIIYFLSALIFLIYSKKSILSWFWALFCGASLFFVFIGNSYFYIFFVPATFIALLIISEIKDAFGIFAKWILVGGLIIMSIFQHSRLIKTYSAYNYYSFGDQISACIPKQNVNLIVGQMVPDPFVYFIEKRKDLKLSYGNMNHFEESFTYAFPKADYSIFPAMYDEIITNDVYKKAQEDPKTKIEINEYIKTKIGVDPRVLDIIKKYKKSVCLVKGTNFYSSLAVFSFK